MLFSQAWRIFNGCSVSRSIACWISEFVHVSDSDGVLFLASSAAVLHGEWGDRGSSQRGGHRGSGAPRSLWRQMSGGGASRLSLLTHHVSLLGGAGAADSPLGSAGGIEARGGG